MVFLGSVYEKSFSLPIHTFAVTMDHALSTSRGTRIRHSKNSMKTTLTVDCNFVRLQLKGEAIMQTSCFGFTTNIDFLMVV